MNKRQKILCRQCWAFSHCPHCQGYWEEKYGQEGGLLPQLHGKLSGENREISDAYNRQWDTGDTNKHSKNKDWAMKHTKGG